MLQKPQAFLIDMDGTMIDSEKYWIRAEQKVAQKYGKFLPEEFSINLVGESIASSCEKIINYLNINISSKDFANEVVDTVKMYMENEGINWRPGAKQLLEYANANNIPAMLVTSSYEKVCKIFVEVANEQVTKGLCGYISGDMVVNPKPNPECYIKASQQLGVDIKQCVVIEDSNAGINAGIKAGAKVIAIPFIMKLKKHADVNYVPSMKKITPELLDKILSNQIIDLCEEKCESNI